MDSLSSFADPPRPQSQRLKQQAPANSRPKIPNIMLDSLSLGTYKPNAAAITDALGDCPEIDPKRMEALGAGQPARS